MLEIHGTPSSSSLHETSPERLNCPEPISPHTSQLLWESPTSCLTLHCHVSLARIICEAQDFMPLQECKFFIQHNMYLLVGTAPLPFQSKAAWVIVWTGSKDAWKQPPLFSDALNHSFPEESWWIPRLPQIKVCLFRCRLHAQEQSSDRHCNLGSATEKNPTKTTPHTTRKPHHCIIFTGILTFP